MSSKVFITENVLRDAHQCLIATRMRTEHMLPICSELDEVGYWALESWGGATFDACVRFLKEDPWERLRALKQALVQTPQMMLLRGQNILGYRHYADDVVKLFVETAAKNGVEIFRVFDALNDIRNCQLAIDCIKRAGKQAQGAICYTVSPVHNIDAFVALARAFADLGCDSLAIKDMAGLLTPQVAATLVKAIQKAVSLPLHIHSHATSGLASIAMYEAVKEGCRHIDTAISSFAEGASHPATESMVAAFRGSPFDTGLDLVKLERIADYFRDIRRLYTRFESEATRVDPKVHINQIPGGMISNLYNQLREQNALEKLNDVLHEVPIVRKDLGYPPLVTPTSQIVGTQAVLNVLTGERYKNITNEVKLYLKGYYGKSPALVNRDLQVQAIGKEDIIDCRPADLITNELDSLREEIGTLAKSDEDLLIYAMFPDVGKAYLQERADHALQPEPLVLPDRVNTAGQADMATKFKVTLHGEDYHIEVKGAGHKEVSERSIYLTIDDVPEEVIVTDIEKLSTQQAQQNSTEEGKHHPQRPIANQPGDVSVAMPCQVIDVLVKVGDTVAPGDVLFITEVMKMESEVSAPLGGTIDEIFIKKGDSVTPDETLVKIVS